ncbi:MAG: hypothetical protein ACJ8BW_30945 [Ktedonobacteraceae bacterium]
MKQRAVLVSAFVLMIVFVLVTVAFFSSALSAKQNISIIIPTLTSTPTLAPTPTPSPIPTTPTPTPSPTPVPLVNGLSASLLDVASGRTLLNVNSHMRLPMWSTTKLMTALLAIERLSPDTMVTVQQSEWGCRARSLLQRSRPGETRPCGDGLLVLCPDRLGTKLPFASNFVSS